VVLHTDFDVASATAVRALEACVVHGESKSNDLHAAMAAACACAMDAPGDTTTGTIRNHSSHTMERNHA
jgi:hypothetical protein